MKRGTRIAVRLRLQGTLIAWVVATMLLARNVCAENDVATASKNVDSALTLERSIALALDNSFTVRRAAAQLAEARAESQYADRITPSDPQVEVWTGHRNGLGNSVDATSTDSTTDIGIRVSQELWIAGQGRLTKQVASTKLDSVQRRLEFLTATTAAQVRGAFLRVLITNASLTTANQSVGLARTIKGNAETRLHTGQGTRLELNSATIELGKSELAESRADVENLRARVALGELLALSPRAPIDVVGELIAPSMEMPDESELIGRSVERRQDLAAAADDVMAARESLQLTRRQLIPNLSVFGGYATEGKEDIATIGVTFGLPLSRQSNQASVAAARARLDQAQVDQDELRLGVERDVVIAVASYQAARRQVQAFGKPTLALAAENVEFARVALEAGKVGSPVVTEMQATFLETRAAYLTGLESLALAAVDLERATGGIIVVADSSAGAQ